MCGQSDVIQIPGTERGLSLLVVLFESEEVKTVKLAGAWLITSKCGNYLANEIFDIVTSDADEIKI